MPKQETYDYLRARGVAFEITAHPAVFNMEECAAVDMPYPEDDAKNIFVRDAKKQNYYLITIRHDKRVDLKEFQHRHGTTRLSFASPEDLMAQLQTYAAEGPQLFPDGMTTDQPDAQVCAEILREKMLLCLDKEIPHGTAVEVTRFTEREDTGIIDLDVTIYCEKARHEGIIIGKHGAMLKQLSSLARRDSEKLMGTKVYMETWVKVKENWRDNVNFIRARGYDEQ